MDGWWVDVWMNHYVFSYLYIFFLNGDGKLGLGLFYVSYGYGYVIGGTGLVLLGVLCTVL